MQRLSRHNLEPATRLTRREIIWFTVHGFGIYHFKIGFDFFFLVQNVYEILRNETCKAFLFVIVIYSALFFLGILKWEKAYLWVSIRLFFCFRFNCLGRTYYRNNVNVRWQSWSIHCSTYAATDAFRVSTYLF